MDQVFDFKRKMHFRRVLSAHTHGFQGKLIFQGLSHGLFSLPQKFGRLSRWFWSPGVGDGGLMGCVRCLCALRSLGLKVHLASNIGVPSHTLPGLLLWRQGSPLLVEKKRFKLYFFVTSTFVDHLGKVFLKAHQRDSALRVFFSSRDHWCFP